MSSCFPLAGHAYAYAYSYSVVPACFPLAGYAYAYAYACSVGLLPIGLLCLCPCLCLCLCLLRWAAQTPSGNIAVLFMRRMFGSEEQPAPLRGR